jgi:bacillithiol biosynthesis deacetylase BshB1
MTVDALVIGAHPDDIELIVGGTIAKLTTNGKHVAGVDLTRGEMGTRGNPQIRRKEAKKAAKVLGLSERICLDLGDGKLENNIESKAKLIKIIRELRPLIIMTHHWEDLHPDHCQAGEMMKDIMYTSGIVNFPTGGVSYRPNEVLFFMGHLPFVPSFIVDVSNYFEKKIEAIKCYESQLYKADSMEPETHIAQPDFILSIEARARHYGSQIQRIFGEPFYVRRPMPVEDPVEIYRPFSKI